MAPNRPLALLILAGSLQAGCAPSPVTYDSSGALLEKLQSGAVSLQCGLSCASQFRADRLRRAALIAHKRWADLGIYVEQSNYDSNLSWYYLGRSAQALGAIDAAKKYYQAAIDETKSGPTCQGLLDACEGVRLPFDAQSRLSALANTDAIPRSQPLPDPATIKQSGTVTVGFDIAADGTVQSPRILSSQPAGVFDAISLAAVSTWRYEPRRVGGQAAAQPGNKVNLHFSPDTAASATSPQILYEPPPNYPRAAYKDGVAGWADVRFSVNELGIVDSAAVIRSSPPGLFDVAALYKVSNTLYAPPLVDGKPARIYPSIEHVRFDPANAVFAPERLHRPKAVYPPAANQLGLEGHCSMLLHLNQDGSINTLQILEDSFPGMFTKACEEAASSLSYKPPASDPTGRTASVAQFNLTFAIDQKSRHLLKPGDWVRVQYEVRRDGGIKHVVVLDKSPDAGSDRPIIWALESLRSSNPTPGANDPAGATHTLTLISPSTPPDLHTSAK